MTTDWDIPATPNQVTFVHRFILETKETIENFSLHRSFVLSGVAVGCWQSFDVPSAHRQHWGLGLAQCAFPL